MPISPTWEDTTDVSEPSWDDTSDLEATPPPPRFNDELIAALPEQERKRLDILGEMAAERGRGEKLQADVDELARQEYSINRFTARGMANQPERIMRAVAGIGAVEGVPEGFDPAKPHEPIFPIPVPQGTNFMAGLGQLGVGLLNTLQTPEMLITAPAMATPIGRALIGMEMGKEIPGQVARGAEVVGDISTTTAEKVVATGEPIIAAGMTALLSGQGQVRIPPEVRVKIDQAKQTGLTKSAAAAEEAVVKGQDAIQKAEAKAPNEEGAGVNIRREVEVQTPVAPKLVPVVRTEGGRIYAGERHPFAMQAALEDLRAGKISGDDLSTMQQGFYDVTSRKFLTREEAAIARKSGTRELTSEQIPEAELKANVAEYQKSQAPDALAQLRDLPGTSNTSEAMALGKKVPPEAIPELEQVAKTAAEDAAKVMAEVDALPNPTEADLTRMSVAGNRSQLLSEAVEAAKGGEPAILAREAATTTDIAPSPIANARLAAERPIQEPYSDKHSVSLQVTATEWPAGSDKAVRSSLPKELADKLDSLRFFQGEGVPTNKALSIPARVQLTFKNKADAQAAIDYFKPPPSSELPAAAFFERESEVAGLGRSSLPPTVEDVRAQRAQDAGNLPPNPPTQGVPDTAGDSVKMRKSAERAITSPMVPEPVQERIQAAPESRYTQQSMQRVEEAVSALPDNELAAIPRDSDLYTAARLEQAKRLFEAGKNDAGYEVFVELEKEGTRLGQLINQFKLLKGSRPENVVVVINGSLKKAGKDLLTSEQSARAIKITTDAKAADAKLDAATKEWQKNPTAENAARAEAVLDDSNAQAVELQKFTSKFQPRSTSSILKSILQGNLLTPISEVANFFSNMSFLPFRALDRTVASGMDMIDATLRNKPREITVQPLIGTVEALKGAVRGAKQIPGILARGTGDVIKGEARAGLHPIRAWINQFAKNPEMPTTGGKLTLKDRMNLALEGTFGIPAEAMLRGLGSGDAPFKEGARARATAGELKLNKVPRSQWELAQRFPELFLPKESLNRIQSDTMRAVFQGESKTLNHIVNWAKSKGEFMDFLVATVAPYKLTPWNIVREILSYNPIVAATRSVYDAAKGNSRSAKLNGGKLVVGTLLTTTGTWLYSKGLLAPSLDERDEAQKARILSGNVLPPNHINISGLKRAMDGGDPAFKSGDETVDVFRAGGLAGSMFYMTANIGRDIERGEKVPDSEVWQSILRQSTLEQARFGMNQSFLSGVEGLLTAIKDGHAETFLKQWANTVTSIPLPNTLNTISRTSREYKPDFSAKTFNGQIENMLRGKLGFAGLDDYLPLKRDLWGQPMKETPEGRNAIFYHFFDISKNKQVTSDPVELELYRLWRTSADSKVIPSIPQKQITVANSVYPLTPKLYEQYAEQVGTNRRQIVDALVINPNFHKLTDEQKMKILESAYLKGLNIGKALFYDEHQNELTPKAGRAGFRSE